MNCSGSFPLRGRAWNERREKKLRKTSASKCGSDCYLVWFRKKEKQETTGGEDG